MLAPTPNVFGVDLSRDEIFAITRLRSMGAIRDSSEFLDLPEQDRKDLIECARSDLKREKGL